MRVRQYEGMFLFDAGFATDLSKAEGEIRRILDRAEAELVFARKWDERRLAFEIAGRKRGTYVLTYFKCRPDAVAGIERDAQLSEQVLRLLVLRADQVTWEQMNEFAPERRTAVLPGDARPEEAEEPLERKAGLGHDEQDAEPVTSSARSHDSDDAG